MSASWPSPSWAMDILLPLPGTLCKQDPLLFVWLHGIYPVMIAIQTSVLIEASPDPKLGSDSLLYVHPSSMICIAV